MLFFNRFIILIMLLSASQRLFAQGFFTTSGVANSMYRDVAQGVDGSFMAVGVNASLKQSIWHRADANGQITLAITDTTTYGTTAVVACADSCFVVLSEGYNLSSNIVRKLDASGNIVWSLILTNPGLPSGLTELVALPNGDFLAVGQGRDAQFATRIWIVKISASGTQLWGKLVGNGGVVSRAEMLPDGSIVIAGNKNDGPFLAKTNATGSLIWQKTYEFTQIRDMLLTTDGGIALLGPNSIGGRQQIKVAKTNADGNLLWQHSELTSPPTQDPVPIPVFNCFAQSANSQFFVPFWGYNSSPNPGNLQYLRLESNGTLSGRGDAGVQVTPDAMYRINHGSFIIAGSDANGNNFEAFLLKTSLETPYASNQITSSVYHDLNLNCLKDTGEPALAQFVAVAENTSTSERFYAFLETNGDFNIVTSPGTYRVMLAPNLAPNSYYNICDTPLVTVVGPGQIVTAPPIGVDVIECPLLELELSNGLLRRCMNTTLTLNYCNVGSVKAEDVSLVVTLDSLYEYVSSSVMPASFSSNTFMFNLPDVQPGVCGQVTMICKVRCEAALGDVLCAEAHIYPDSICGPPGGLKDGSNLEVSGKCINSQIEFTIRNTGLDMTQPMEYVIIEDMIMFRQTPIQLSADQDTVITVTPSILDSCYALQLFDNISSVLSRPTAIVPNCLNGGNLNLALQLPLNETSPSVAVICDEVIGSFDPNDKYGFPLGFGTDHFIEKGQSLDYRIRFQNTGNDTAFLVVIRDTLPATLNPATLRPVGASHPYEWTLSDNGVVTITFPNILLPDSTTNEPASHGYVTFNIQQQPNLPEGTKINNSAAIYFDFNEPVITNLSQHTIGRPAITVIQNPPTGRQLYVTVQPNPFTAMTRFVLSAEASVELKQFSL
ncbi:MAG: hypothetical protein IT269_12020, partial [Saprospiraceae bacterium]|nr:hypothetical protein [Saprospiraceae bacterium]